MGNTRLTVESQFSQLIEKKATSFTVIFQKRQADYRKRLPQHSPLKKKTKPTHAPFSHESILSFIRSC